MQIYVFYIRLRSSPTSYKPFLFRRVQSRPKDSSLSHQEIPLNFDRMQVFQYKFRMKSLVCLVFDNSKCCTFSCVCFFSGEVLSYMEHQFRDSRHQNSTTDVSKFCVLTGNVSQLFCSFEMLCCCSP